VPSGVFKFYPCRAIEIGTEATSSFKANRSRLNHYIAGEPIEGEVSFDLPNTSST